MGTGAPVSQPLEFTWKPPGPVSAAFMASMARIQIICGPLGSGKTSTALLKGVRLAAAQAPSTRDRLRNSKGELMPVRKFKFCVVRDTYGRLWENTLPSWFKRIPQTVGNFVGAKGGPATHRVVFALQDGTMVDLHVDFIAMGDNAAESVLDGYEPTCFYLDAANLLAEDVFNFANTRVGRYPDMVEGGPSWCGVLMGCNAPQFSSWLFQGYLKHPPSVLAAKGVELFMQPSGFAPDAENLDNLPGGRAYYTEQAKTQPAWMTDRLLRNKPGFDRAGKPIYADWDEAYHVAGDILQPDPALPLLIGIDGGGSPAAAFGQRAPRQLRILRELCADPGTGPRRFGEDVAAFLARHFPDIRPTAIRAWADPSTFYGGDREREGEEWVAMFAAASGLRVRPAPSNAPATRWEAVRRHLAQHAAEHPPFLLSPDCYVLREGFASGYRFRQVAGREGEYQETAEKNRYSHVHDALQYLALGGGEYAEILGRQSSTAAILRHRATPDWDPLDQREIA